MSDVTQYEVPTEQLRLSGPVVRPAPGTLPLRGDIAHIALAGTYLVPHYAIPQPRVLGDATATLRLLARDDAEPVAELAAGSAFELLDTAGDWCWGSVGPEGPSGWLHSTALVALEQ
ncbi:MAG: hypothetical protein R3D99_13480 [Altererythrobacter sp.]